MFGPESSDCKFIVYSGGHWQPMELMQRSELVNIQIRIQSICSIHSSLSENSIGDVGGKSLGQSLSQCPQLRELK